MCLAPGAPLGLMSILHVIALGVLRTHTVIPLLPRWAEAYLFLVHCLALPAGRKALWIGWMVQKVMRQFQSLAS